MQGLSRSMRTILGTSTPTRSSTCPNSIRIHWLSGSSLSSTRTKTERSPSVSSSPVLSILTLGLASLYGTDEEHKLRFAFKIYDIDEDGFITNGELFTVLKMMVGNNLTDLQLQQLVDRTIIKADLVFIGLC